MKITIIAVGKIKEKFFSDAVLEYSKRLSKFCKLNIIEVSDEKANENLSDSQLKIIKKIEGERILKSINSDGFVFALEINGKNISSEAFAEIIDNKKLSYSHFYFIIGGSLGLSEEVSRHADYSLSFSNMTFPHQLMRVILLEQIYRACKISANEPYHK